MQRFNDKNNNVNYFETLGTGAGGAGEAARRSRTGRD